MFAPQLGFATQSVTLAWDPSPDTNVVGYRVYYGVVSRTYTNVVNVGNATNVTINGLVEGTTYYFAATAYNSLGMESDYSAESVYTAPGLPNQAPTLNALANIRINQNAGQQTVTLTGITSGSVSEIQTLAVTAVSDNTALIPNPTVTYTSPTTNGTLRFTPVAGAVGLANITVTVNDGGPSNNIVTRTFSVTVNSPPTVSTVGTQTIATNSSAGPIAFVVGDLETAASALTVSAASSATALIPTNRIVFGGSGANRTVTITPLANQKGTANITLSVSDGSAAASMTFQVNVLVPPPAPVNFNIVTNGLGIVTPNLKAQQLVAGKTYTITAVPAAGQEFAGWTGTYNSSNPKLTFLMSTNVTLQATFIASPYIPAAGNYNGLFYQDDEVRLAQSGAFNVKVTTKGTYSGKLQIGTRKYPLTGKLSLQGLATNVIVRKGSTPLTVSLKIGAGSQSDQMLGYVTNAAWVATLLGDRAIFNTKTNPSPFAGRYTLAVPGQTDDSTLPVGNGFGTLRVDKAGNLRFGGSLADGTKVSQGVPLSKHGLWPLYAALYSGSGSLLSWFAFTNQAESDLAGTLSWIKSANSRAKYYGNGFTNQCAGLGSLYVCPVGSNILDGASAQVQFVGGNLTPGFTNLVSLAANSKVLNSSSNHLGLSFSLSGGSFQGSATDPNSGKSYSFSGVVLQKLNAGYGNLLGTNQSSQTALESGCGILAVVRKTLIATLHIF